jgi:hypothetical protein
MHVAQSMMALLKSSSRFYSVTEIQTYRACEVCVDEGGAVDDGVAKVGLLEVALRRIRL